MTYQITLQQLDALALCISNMDGRTNPKTNNANAFIAHGIIGEVLGDDIAKIYAPDDEKVA